MSRHLLKTLLKAFTFVFIFLINGLPANTLAQASEPELLGAGSTNPKRVALVVGNAEYPGSDRHLKNSIADARLIGDLVKSLGFSLIDGEISTDLDKVAFERILKRFGDESQGADIAFFYYAGHAMQIRNKNWLFPAGNDIDVRQNPIAEDVSVRAVLDQMMGAKHRLIFLDACNDAPKWVREVGGIGLAGMESPLKQCCLLLLCRVRRLLMELTSIVHTR